MRNFTERGRVISVSPRLTKVRKNIKNNPNITAKDILCDVNASGVEIYQKTF